MKHSLKIYTLVLLTLFGNCLRCSAQVLKPVKWSYAFKKTGANAGIVYLKADIDSGWHIYSVNQREGGPVKTSFQFKRSNKFDLIGKPIEPRPKKHYEKAFGIDVLYFERSVVFQQKIRFKPALSGITGKLTFMVCNDHQCLQPEDIEFTIPIK